VRRLLALLILVAAPAWATTYYVDTASSGGNGTTQATSGTNAAWKTLSAITGLVAGDSVLLKKGCVWRESYTPSPAGTSGSKITMGTYGSGASPIISGANLATGWTVYSGNVWQSTIGGSQNPGLAFVDGTPGVRRTSIGACVNQGDYYWTGGVLYLYSASSPGTFYTNPGVEARVRQYAIIAEQPYWIFDGITAEKSWMGCWKSASGGNIEVKNGVGQYGGDGFWMGTSGTTISGYNVHNNVFYYNDERGIGSELKVANSTFYRNEVYQNGTSGLGDAYTAGIKFWDTNPSWACEGIELYENYVHDNVVGIWFDGVQPPTNPLLVHHNLLVNDTHVGVMLELTKSAHVWGNVISGCGLGSTPGMEAWNYAGISISGRLDSTFISSNNLLYNNTIYGASVGISVWLDNYQLTTTRIDNNLIKNNVILGSTLRALSTGRGGDNITYGSGNVYQYNCFGAQSSNFIEWTESTYYSTYAAWEAATGVILDGGTTHSINADPLLTNPSGGVFTLQASSPCIDVGANLGSTYQDGLLAASTWPSGVVTGAQGSYGSGWEIGAYIYQSSGSPYILILGALFSLIPAIAVGQRGR
jgi:hypothetical protein